MNAEQESIHDLVDAVSRLGATRVLFKVLAANDNSKNQMYFGSSFELLQMLPLGPIVSDLTKRERLKARLNLSWLDDENRLV
ncbi:MAG: hypothetical protein ACTHQM_24970 [Thermoanaerobaculia bacterium]